MSTLIEIVVTTLLSLLLTTGGKQETEVSDKVQPEVSSVQVSENC